MRCNPSSGNLHPTEGYALLPARPGLPAGVYHYVSRDHRLERRCTLRRRRGRPARRGACPGAFLVGLSSIHWREAWKYGERAFRYCQHDAGHALAAVRYAAPRSGWSATLLDTPADADVAAWLGLDRDERLAGLDPADREHPAALLVGRPPLPTSDPETGRRLSRAAAPLRAGLGRNPLSRRAVTTWTGRPRRRRRGDGGAAGAAARGRAGAEAGPVRTRPCRRRRRPPAGPPRRALIRQRRSCLALDGRTSIAAETFYAMLDRLLPRPGVPPWDVLPWGPLVHPASSSTASAA